MGRVPWIRGIVEGTGYAKASLGDTHTRRSRQPSRLIIGIIALSNLQGLASRDAATCVRHVVGPSTRESLYHRQWMRPEFEFVALGTNICMGSDRAGRLSVELMVRSIVGWDWVLPCIGT